MISTALELAAHLGNERHATRDLLICMVSDLQENTDAYMDILERGWEAAEMASALLVDLLGPESEFSYEDQVANPVIEPGTDWQMPLEYSFEGDTDAYLTDMGVAKVLIPSVTHRLLWECTLAIEKAGLGNFGRISAEALESLEKDEDVEYITENAIAVEAAHRIAEWVGNAIESAGESIVLYAVMELVVEEMNDGA